MNRCTGHCCRSFFLPSSAGALRIGALAAIRGRGADVQEGHLAYRSVLRVYRWGFQAMPTGWFHFVSRAELIFIADMVIFDREIDGAHHYNCRHLGAEGDCTAYAERPSLCRDYPYDQPCHHSGCTWSARRLATDIALERDVRPRGWLAIRRLAARLSGRLNRRLSA